MSIHEEFPKKPTDSLPAADRYKAEANARILMALMHFDFAILTQEAREFVTESVLQARTRHNANCGYMLHYYPEPDRLRKLVDLSFGVLYSYKWEDGSVTPIVDFIPYPELASATARMHFDHGPILPIFPEDINQDELAYRMAKQDT